MPLMPLATAAPETAVRQVAQVAVDARVGSHSGLFDYAVPNDLIGLIEVGHRVRVPFGKRSVTGFVYALDQAPSVLELKPIEAMIDAEPVLPAVLVELAGFVASHYLVPLDEVIRAVVPPRVRAIVRRTVKRRCQSRILQKASAVTVSAAVELEPAQLAARERISVAIARHESDVFLLHGVTGSGKTEVYLALLEEVLAAEGQALVLVPEIALTPQTVGRFAARFPGRLAVLHSGLTEAERAAEWWRIRRGEADIVIGPRAAVFAPLPRLRLIAIDEEESSAFKQDRIPPAPCPGAAPAPRDRRRHAQGDRPATFQPAEPRAPGGDRWLARAARAIHPLPEPTRAGDLRPLPRLRPGARMSALQRGARLSRVVGPPAVPLRRQHRTAPATLPRLWEPLHQELRRGHGTHRARGPRAVSQCAGDPARPGRDEDAGRRRPRFRSDALG